jgi:N-acetylglutamate synthase-like GNAT family acetyltransferase
MIVRQATREDLDGVLSCLATLNQNIVNYFTRKRIKFLLKNYCIAVVENRGRIMGACVIDSDSKDTLEVFAIGVHPYWQNHGVGSKLLRWAEAMAYATNRDVLSADSYYFYEAKDFYEKAGYFATHHPNGWGYTFYKYL